MQPSRFSRGGLCRRQGASPPLHSAKPLPTCQYRRFWASYSWMLAKARLKSGGVSVEACLESGEFSESEAHIGSSSVYQVKDAMRQQVFSIHPEATVEAAMT